MARLFLFFSLLIPVFSAPFPPALHTFEQNPLSNLPTISHASGQTFEPCTSDSDCLPARTCVGVKSKVQCTTRPCICLPGVSLLPCSISSDCDDGELCAAGLPDVSFSCVSDSVVQERPRLREVNAETDRPLEDGDGLTLAQCRTDLQCAGARKCVLPDYTRSLACAPKFDKCICAPPTGVTHCASSQECPTGEACVNGLVDNTGVCAGEKSVSFGGLEPVGQETGLTLDSCAELSDCEDDRICLGVTGICQPGQGRCGCLPISGLSSCGSESDCVDGETCASGDVGTVLRANCVSKALVASSFALEEYDGDGIGVAGARCGTSGACMGKLSCFIFETLLFTFEELTACPNFREFCVCAPPKGLRKCTSGEDCPRDGEECIIPAFGTLEAACLSVSFLKDARYQLVPGPSPSEIEPTPSEIEPTPSPMGPGGTLLTLQACISSEECAGNRQCSLLSDISSNPPASCNDAEISAECVCSPPRSLRECGEGENCIGGEVCAKQKEDVVGSTPSFATPVCVSKEVLAEFNLSETEDDDGPPGVPMSPDVSVSPQFSDSAVTSDNGTGGTATPAASASPQPFVCIDAELLRHLKKEELVFEEDNLANVLCDGNKSCATHGHMVTFKGKAMMMRDYCDLVECEERQMMVNSPKYQRALRVDSKTEDLKFTAFAARYATRVEGVALSSLVRVGL